MKDVEGPRDALSDEASLSELLLLFFFLTPPAVGNLPNVLCLRRSIPFIMLIGREPTGSDQTLRQHDVSVSFIMSEGKEEENWKKKR